jgi:hypothetical protein
MFEPSERLSGEVVVAARLRGGQPFAEAGKRQCVVAQVPILLLVGLVRVQRGGSSGTVWLGLTALVSLLVHLPFDKAALSDHCVNPTGSDKACHPAWWLVSLGALPLLMVLTALLTFREAGGVWRVPRLRR